MDHLEQTHEHIMDRLDQAITCLTWLLDDANKDHKKERNLPRDLPRGRLNPKPIPEDPSR
jgi:hypothetical protein